MKPTTLVGTYLPLIVAILFSMSCTSTPPREPAQAKEEPAITQIANGPFDDCDQRELFDQHENFNWVCTDNYVHIYPQKHVPTIASRELKIGAFNVYHLGDDQGRLKDLKAMAAIMNKWDLVGATEMMPLPKGYSDENRKIRQAMKQGPQNIPADWRVVEPGYFLLLKALQLTDASWSLIFQAMPEGDGNTGEMAGFFYRSSKINLQMWNYCPTSGLTDKINPNVMGLNFGCLAQVPAAQAKLMSKRAFVASFKSGKFDFIGLVSHMRFRPASPAAQAQQLIEICGRYPLNAVCSISKDRVGRFYEVKAVVDQFPRLEQFDRDLIYMGDFNLDLTDINQQAWKASVSAAPNYDIYQSGKTSLSLANQSLANSYDHFILRADTLSECDLKSIKSYDFTQIGTDEAEDVTLRRLSYLLRSSTHRKTEEQLTASLNQLLKAEKLPTTYLARALNPVEKAVLIDEVKRWTSRLKNNKFWVLREYLSDHIPIEMTCNTKKDDD